MAPTRDFRETIRERAQREPEFLRALLLQGLQLITDGDSPIGRSILRNYFSARMRLPRQAGAPKA